MGNDVLPKLKHLKIVDSNIPDTDFLDVRNGNILEHSLFM